LVEVNYDLRFSEPKTDAGRSAVSLDPATVAALGAHRKCQAEERLAWKDGGADLGFTKEDSSPIHPER
jgi:hypothetical protein